MRGAQLLEVLQHFCLLPKVAVEVVPPSLCRVWLALEWKGIDYDTMLINLRDKPDWFLELVPTGLVPVAKIRDKLIHESYDILRVRPEDCS